MPNATSPSTLPLGRTSGKAWIAITLAVAGLVAGGSSAWWFPIARQCLLGYQSRHQDGFVHDDQQQFGQEHSSHGNSLHDGHSHGHKRSAIGSEHTRENDSHHPHQTQVHGMAGEDHSHDHVGDSQGGSQSIKLDRTARQNIGLRTGIIQLGTFVRTVSVPAMVIERPGRTQVDITAPMTGVVTRVYPVEGEVVQPDQPLFDLRLTHEDLVTSQRDFLQSAQELDVVRREIERLQSLPEGVIPGRRVLEHEYEMEKIQAALHAQRQGLLLHGLSEAQIDGILESRKLLPSLTVKAPAFDDDVDPDFTGHFYHVQQVLVRRGQSVAAGSALSVLADHRWLYVEGQAFDDDAELLVQAARESWDVMVSHVEKDRSVDERLELQILYVADRVERDTRSLPFYLSLPNHLVRDESDHGHRFVAWRFRPGQRMEVKIPIGEPWENQIVLPADAVIREGAESFLFVKDGDLFQRMGVHVMYADRDSVVVARDASLVGKSVVLSGAYQMHLTLQNQIGGGLDAHHGHSH